MGLVYFISTITTITITININIFYLLLLLSDSNAQDTGCLQGVGSQS